MDIKINNMVLDTIKRRASEKNQSVEDYVNSILVQIVQKISSDREEEISKEDEDKIKKRLRDLGYME